MRALKVICSVVAFGMVFILATSTTIRLLLRDTSTVACPDVTGLDVGEARRLVEQKGLSFVIAKYEKKKDVPYNRVLIQKPDAALSVRVGRAVTVVLSDGPRPVPIPNLVGLPLDEARTRLSQQGMAPKKVLYVAHGPEGLVVAQAPGSGENILDEDGFLLIVGGREKCFYVMPDVSKEDYGSLIQEMEEKRLNYATMPVAGQGSGGGEVTLKAAMPPGTIFTSDDVVELQMKGGF